MNRDERIDVTRSAVPTSAKLGWIDYFESPFRASEDFLIDRSQPPPQEREPL